MRSHAVIHCEMLPSHPTPVGEDATVLDDGDGVNGISIENHAFSECSDLLYIFDTVEAIMIALRNRFNGLTLHSRIYYNNTTI